MDQLIKSTNRASLALALLGLQYLQSTISLKIDVSTWQDFLVPRRLSKAALEIARETAGLTSKLFSPSGWSTAVQETENKLAAFSLFEHIDLKLGFPPNQPVNLPTLLEKTASLDIYDRVWATEGLGHYYAASQIASGRQVDFLRSEEADNDILSARIVPLAAGLGLALAESTLSLIEKDGDNLKSRLETFIDQCSNALPPEYVEIAYESLGLVTRNLYPQLLQNVEQQLFEIEPSMADYFWHGVGRGTYFSPSAFLPLQGIPGQGISTCIQDSAKGPRRRNAVAGFTWALMLVNIRQPEIMAAFMEHYGADLEEYGALYNGIWAASIIWKKSTGDDSFLQNFTKYSEYLQDLAMQDLWQKLVAQACNDAIDYCSNLDQQIPTGQLFRYRTPSPQIINAAYRDTPWKAAE